MAKFFTDFELFLIVGVAAFVAGVLFSTKIKDWFQGIPSDLRAAFNQVETSTVAEVKVAQTAVVAKLPGVKVKVAAPVVVPVAPVVVVPVAPATPVVI